MPARTRPDLNTGRWKRIRLTVLKRDAYECQMRGPKCTGVATSVDHVIPYAQGGDDNYNNLRAACRTCNTTAGARQERGGKFDLSRSTPAASGSLSRTGHPGAAQVERKTHRIVP